MAAIRRAMREGPPMPVMAPQLPSADRLLPYLRRIDAARVYTNFGPLVMEFEARLGRQLSLPAGALVTASSGTAALVASVLAAAGRATPRRPFALVPSYTFVATAVAAEQCGYQPYLADIDPETWMLDPQRLLEHPELRRIGVVIPVSAYGKPVPQADWLAFREKTGIPVVIDGAASFEAIESHPSDCLGSIPVVMSFHATKSLACGEGGAVACTDLTHIRDAGRALNFGFLDSRVSCSASVNGKLSEYHAAVGLAELDDWTAKRSALSRVAGLYRRHADDLPPGASLVAWPEICSSYVLLKCQDAAQSMRVRSALDADRIGYRLWYGTGLHAHPHFALCSRSNLDVTDRLAPTIIGLPVASDMGQDDATRVVSKLVPAPARVATSSF